MERARGVTANGNNQDPAVNVLFVCTGNTCRSPMAQAIAEHLLMKAPPKGVRVHIRSAGLSAAGGEPSNAQTDQALASVGVDPLRHRAQPLTQELLKGATVVFGMTRSHVQQIRALSPEGAAKVQVLDPGGQDVVDPIGRGPEVYRQTAERLLELVSVRLKELVPHGASKGAG